jgi:hypothetical protein
MIVNPYEEKLQKLLSEEQELYEERNLVEQLYVIKLAENAHHFGVKFVKKLKHSLNIRIRIPDYMADIEWLDFLTTDKKQIKENLIKIIERLNQISDRLEKIGEEMEYLSDLRKEFDYFTRFPVDDADVIMKTVEKLVDRNRR